MSQQQQRLLAKYSEASAQVEGNIFFDLIERVGSFGTYQIFTQVVWCVMSYMAGGLLFMSAFLFYQDPYTCPDPVPGGASCLDYVCNNFTQQQRRAFIPQEKTLTSLANNFGDYRCPEQKAQLDLIQSLMFSGFPIGTVTLFLLGGLLGKKTLMLGNLSLALIGLGLVRWAPSVLVGGIGMFCCMFGLNINMNISFPFITQTVSQKHRPTFSMLISVFYAIGSLSNVLWYYAFKNYQDVILYCYGIPGIFCMVSLIFFIKDTPFCMITKSSPERALRGLHHIAKINKIDYFELSLEELKQIQNDYNEVTLTQDVKKKAKTFSVLDLFKYKSLRKMTLIMLFMDGAIGLQYYTPSLMLEQFQFNIFVSGLVVESSQLVASIVCCFMVFSFPRRIIAIVSFAVIFGSALTLTFIWDQYAQVTSDDISSNIMVLIFIFLIGFCITAEFNFFVVYINELMPTQIRIIGLAFIKCFGGVVLMVQSEIISACLNAGFKVMILFAILAASCVIASYYLPQTVGKMPPDMIEELRNAETTQEVKSRDVVTDSQ